MYYFSEIDLFVNDGFPWAGMCGGEFIIKSCYGDFNWIKEYLLIENTIL